MALIANPTTETKASLKALVRDLEAENKKYRSALEQIIGANVGCLGCGNTDIDSCDVMARIAKETLTKEVGK